MENNRLKKTDQRVDEDLVRRLNSEVEEKEFTIRQLRRDLLKAKEEKIYEVQQLKQEQQKTVAEKNRVTENRDQLSKMLKDSQKKLRLAQADFVEREKKYNVLLQDAANKYAESENERKHLSDRSHNLSNKLEVLQFDYDDYVKRSTAMHESRSDVDVRCQTLQKERDNLVLALSKSKSTENACINKIKRLHAIITKAVKLISSSCKKTVTGCVSIFIITSQSKNQYILRSSTLLNSIRLTHEIEKWCAKVSGENSEAESLSPSAQAEFLSMLRGLGNKGILSANFLEPQLTTLYADGRYRVALLRHTFAVYLYYQILRPYAFSLDPDISDYLTILEDKIFVQGESTSFTVYTKL